MSEGPCLAFIILDGLFYQFCFLYSLGPSLPFVPLDFFVLLFSFSPIIFLFYNFCLIILISSSLPLWFLFSFLFLVFFFVLFSFLSLFSLFAPSSFVSLRIYLEICMTRQEIQRQGDTWAFAWFITTLSNIWRSPTSCALIFSCLELLQLVSIYLML